MKKGDKVWVVDDNTFLNGTEEQSVFTFNIIKGTLLKNKQEKYGVYVSVPEVSGVDAYKVFSPDQIFDHKPSNEEVRKNLLDHIDFNIKNSKDCIESDRADLKFLKHLRWVIKSSKVLVPGDIG